MPLISVIIPVYNVERYLDKTIKSCLNQTLRDIEIIVVNDGSPDNSQTIVDNHSKNDKRIISLQKQNEGVTLARKAGLEVAKGEYVFFLDGDDYLTNNALELLYKKAKECNADWVVGDFIIEFENKKTIERKFNDFDVANNIDFIKYSFENRDFYFMGRLINTELIKNIDLNIPANITYGEDNLAVIQLGFALKKAVKVNAPILYYVQRSESVTNKLKKQDLIERAKAIKMLISFVRKKEIEDLVKDELNLFALNELYYCIMTGYVDKDFADTFLKISVIRKNYKNRNVNFKQCLVLMTASINIKLVIKILAFIKSVK